MPQLEHAPNCMAPPTTERLGASAHLLLFEPGLVGAPALKDDLGAARKEARKARHDERGAQERVEAVEAEMRVLLHELDGLRSRDHERAEKLQRLRAALRE